MKDSDQARLFETRPTVFTREELIAAVVEEMAERPPVRGCAGDSVNARRMRRTLAGYDVGRIYRAAARLGAEIRLVPVQPVQGGDGEPL